MRTTNPSSRITISQNGNQILTTCKIYKELNYILSMSNEEQAKAIPAQILQGWEKLVKEGKALINQRDQIEASIVTGKQIGRAHV